MSNDRANFHFQAIRQQIARLQQEDAKVWTEIEVVLEDLQVMYEAMQANLDVATLIEQQLLQQNQHYYDLFQAAPIAYLVTDAQGIILEANSAIAQLLNLPPNYLVGKPLSLYIAKGDHLNFRARLHQLSDCYETQLWQLNLCPRKDAAFAAQLQVVVSHTREGLIESVKIGVFNLSQTHPTVSAASVLSMSDDSLPESTLLNPIAEGNLSISPLPAALDGLRVLVVDDEAGICQFITALLEAHGIGVKTVTSIAAALEEVEQFQPDVLLSDICLPGGDGYDLIRQIRAAEAHQGRHIPAAAITAYLDEDREKAFDAGYEAYWYKLSQPTELLEVVGQLAAQGK
ncbi:response regulator [Oscillatoria acuminata]|uniref:Response regulator with CheY-like receiver domain and winged-helix DNA-binding domain n=1 Tax=Oscillatoria acuminata PCC 6304 TaxID=56110 RepID=K9TQT5_9CYAN|nr:response regulator [Oscillatoria acuminata]AFY84531.1 response regulator with CheY-like receiver domain and winged-helix DNA-binding domain [Oscillatoria acuminata PCC 6304]